MYEITVSDDILILNFPNNQGLVFKEGVKDVFGANRRTKYTFDRDENKKITSLQVAAERTVKDIFSLKTN